MSEELRKEIIEIFAGMEGFETETAPEAYLMKIINDMYEAARQSIEWISVDDRLPEEFVPVLTTNHCYLNPSNHRYYVVAERRGDEYADPDTNESIYAPTHWMSLPLPPQDK